MPVYIRGIYRAYQLRKEYRRRSRFEQVEQLDLLELVAIFQGDFEREGDLNAVGDHC